MELRRIRLSALKPGMQGILCGSSLSGMRLERMEELGLVSGTPIQCLFCAPRGTPAAYEIGGAVYALRRTDAAQLMVEMPI